MDLYNGHNWKPGQIFVFGSNLAGVHGAGAAAFALDNCGAKRKHGHGLRGESYAIPTKDYTIKTLPLYIILGFVEMFLHFAEQNPQMEFFVTAIGTGYAGYTVEDIAPMFANAPANCLLPPEFVNK